MRAYMHHGFEDPAALLFSGDLTIIRFRKVQGDIMLWIIGIFQ